MTNIKPFKTYPDVCKDYEYLEVEITTTSTNQPFKVKCKYLRIYEDIHKKIWNWEYDAEMVVDPSETFNFSQLKPEKGDNLTHATLGTWKIVEIGASPIPQAPSYTLKLKKV